jgi:hypothetical protein
MKIELTLKSDYLPNWGMNEGIREIIQNAKDADTQYNAKMSIEHKGNTLIIANDGVTIPHEALLFGHTTKSNNDHLIGKFGEGLKLGILALVRAGHPVKIITGNEVWRPVIENSEKFNASVLVFKINKKQIFTNKVCVEIINISKQDWEKLKENFLFLYKLSQDQAVCLRQGSLLLDNKFKGKIYVKGIFVQHDPKLHYGYDFANADVDRDRRMIASYDLNWKVREMWSSALNEREDLNSKFSTMLFEQAHDVNDITEYNASYFPVNALDFVANEFINKFGKDAVPVENFEQSKDIEHFGKRGIVVNKNLNAVLSSSKLGSYKSIKESLSSEAAHFYSFSDLTDIQKKNLDYAMAYLMPISTIKYSDLDVVSFKSKNLLGIFKNGRIQISILVLNDLMQTFRTLIHEYAHNSGGDGDKAHIESVEKLWMGLLKQIMDSQSQVNGTPDQDI